MNVVVLQHANRQVEVATLLESTCEWNTYM